jgi:hypothetical protein
VSGEDGAGVAFVALWLEGCFGGGTEIPWLRCSSLGRLVVVLMARAFVRALCFVSLHVPRVDKVADLHKESLMTSHRAKEREIHQCTRVTRVTA